MCDWKKEKARFGGIVRDDAGRWTLGFYGFIGNTTITKAELWDIHQGLKITKYRNWKDVIVKTDSQAAKDLIKHGDVNDHPLGVMIDECRRILELMNGCIKHTWHQENVCANMLVKISGVHETVF